VEHDAHAGVGGRLPLGVVDEPAEVTSNGVLPVHHPSSAANGFVHVEHEGMYLRLVDFAELGVVGDCVGKVDEARRRKLPGSD
jgi:hypothetical protein